MTSLATLSQQVTTAASTACPLNHGLAVLDQLLAALTGPEDAAALDIALDLRWQLAQPHTPESALREFFRLRGNVEERHYLACFRLRRWLESQFVAHVSLDRTQPAQPIGLRLDVCNLDELCAQCVTVAADGRTTIAWSRVRFAAASTAPLPV